MALATIAGPSDPRGFYFPPQGSAEAELLAYRDRIINPWSTYRNYHMARVGLAMYYFLNRQWSEIDYSSAFEGVRGTILREWDDEDTVVRPTTNIIDPAVEAEVIALVKRKWTPKITPTSNDPQIKAAAQVANDRLNFRLKQLAWPEKRHRLGLYFATSGTSLMYTGWDKSYLELHTVGAPGAVYCQACQIKLYSANVPVDTARAGIDGQPVRYLETATPVMPDETQTDLQELTLHYCPMCEDARPLSTYQPTEQERMKGNDIFGRPLGIQEPKGGTTIEIDLPFEFHPQNAGAKVAPDTMHRWGRRKVREIDGWLEERYPHLVDLVTPDSISELLYGDPLIGGWEGFGIWSPSFDAGILDHCVNVDEVVELPGFRYPLGRYLVCTKDLVLEDSLLLESAMVEDPEGGSPVRLYVPRVMMSAARYKLRPDEFWGTTIADNEISKQNRLNGLDAQVIETRLRMGSPNLALPADMWPAEGPTQDTAYGSGKLILLQNSLNHPDVKPEVIGSQVFPADGWVPERNSILQDFKMSVGPQAADTYAGKGVGTTSGLQLMMEDDERARSLREDELVTSVAHGWSHMLGLEWVLQVDEDTYRVLGPDKAWRYEQYKGAALRGQYEVEIERGSFISKSVVQREAAREALADQVVVIDSVVTRRRLAEIYGVDTNLNEDTSNQVDHAERMWVDFRQKGLVRTQDDMIDDPQIHFLVFGIHLRTEEGERMADEAGWDDFNRDIAGWQDELKQLMVLEAKAIAFYGSRLTGDDAAMSYAAATAAYQRKKEIYNQQVSVTTEISATPPDPAGAAPPPVVPPAIPPEPPPVPIDLPQLMQDRIYLVWQIMMKKKGKPLQPSPYHLMRALVAAYKISASLTPMGTAPGTGATMIPGDKGLPPTSGVPGAVPPVPGPAPMPEGGG